MSKHSRRLITLLLHSSTCVATVFGALHAHAATLGHSRVTSAPEEPLRIVVQVKNLSATELQSIAAQIAPANAWQEAGLKPPVALDSLSTHLLPGPQDNVMQLVLQSRLVPTDKVLDVLVDLSTDASTQRHQVSVLQTQQPVAVQLAAPTVAPTPAVVSAVPSSKATAQTHTVKQGQTLHGVVRDLRDTRYNDQQLMAALVETNPQAFINGNINLLRAGATLVIPDADTVAAISPQQARQLYQTQLEQFDEYRQRVAKGEPPKTLPTPDETAPELAEPVQELEETVNADRLQLSAQTDEVAKQDQQTATAQELAHTAQRLKQLADPIIEKPVVDEAVIEETQSEPQKNQSPPPQEDQAQSVLAQRPPVSASAMPVVAETPALTEEANSIAPNSTTSLISWLGSNIIALSLGLFVLLVILVAWFLRRTQFTRMEYAEIVSADSVRTREKKETAEAEFREIN